MPKCRWLTVTKQKALGREVAAAVYTTPSNYQVGQGRKAVCEVVNENPKEYITIHARYCTPISERIVEDAVTFLLHNG